MKQTATFIFSFPGRCQPAVPVPGETWGGKAERVTPECSPGTHTYTISPNGHIALHEENSHPHKLWGNVVRLPEHRLVEGERITVAQKPWMPKVEFFTVTTADSVELDTLQHILI